MDPKSNDKCLCRGESEKDLTEEEEAMGPWRQKLEWWGHKSRNTYSHQIVEEAKNRFFPNSSLKTPSLESLEGVWL